MGQKYGYSVFQLGPRVSQKLNEGVRRVIFFTGGSGKESASKLIQDVDRIQSLEVLGLGCLFLCWVLAGRPFLPRGLSLVLGHDSLHLSTSNSALTPSHT